MTIVTNNNINNLSLMLNLNQSGVSGVDGTVLTGNFLDMISMLSDTTDLNLKNINHTELLIDSTENPEVFSTLQLLQKHFEENELNLETSAKAEVVSKFFELVTNTKNTKDDSKCDVVEIVSFALPHPESVPTEKILIKNAIAELNEVGSSNKISLESEVLSINQSIEEKLLEGNDAKSDRMLKLREFPTWPAIVDTSVLVDPEPNSVVIDIESVIEEISSEISEFQISKLFTRIHTDADQKEKTNSYQAEESVNTGDTHKPFDVQPDSLKDEEVVDLRPVNSQTKEVYFDENRAIEKAIISDINLKDDIPKQKETNLNLKIDLGTNSVKIRGDTENFPVIREELPISDDFRIHDKIIAVDIDKVDGQNLLITLGSNRLTDPSSLPKKVILQFSEAKPINSEPSVKVTLVEEGEINKIKKTIDTNHAAVMVKANDSLYKPNIEPDLIFKIFNPEFLQLDYSTKSSLPVGLEPVTRDFSEELSSRLQALVSGEFSSKSMFSTLKDTVSKNIVSEVLADIIKPQISDLINFVKNKTKSKLLLTTADVLGYRETLKSLDNQLSSTYFSSYLNDESKMNVQSTSEVELQPNSQKALDQKLDEGVVKVNFLESARQTSQFPNSTSATTVKGPNIGTSTLLNTINVYEAQFTSRVGMLLAEQMAKGNENFEFQLEPESFGKVRVNVLLENSNIEVKMFVDNTSAIVALRGGENMLQLLAEQHGLKLSDYSVDLQNNQNGQSSDENKNFQKQEKGGLKNIEDVDREIEIKNSDSIYNLNLLA